MSTVVGEATSSVTVGDTARVAVEARGISMIYGPTKALDDVSLSIRGGTIHSLLGRNGAGKSTLVSILAGITSPTAGTIHFGSGIEDAANVYSRRHQVGTVFQHSMLIPHLSVAENMHLGLMPASRGRVNWREARRTTRTLLDEWELDIDERSTARKLTVAERQLVEIVRELSRGARFVILDEPTSRLAGDDVHRLHQHVSRAKSQGVTFLYISHHLAEVMELADTATVLKDGRIVSTREIVSTTPDQLIQDMVGNQSIAAPKASPESTAPVGSGLVVGDLRAPGLALNRIEIKPGEMVGVSGLVGSGKELLAEILAGLTTPEAIAVSLNDVPLRLSSEQAAINAGISTVPGDRHRSGLVLSLGVGENITLSTATRLSNRWGFLTPGRRAARARDLAGEVGIKSASMRQETRHLSGGNQQKAVLARALASEPEILVLVNPTTGVDVASKAAIYRVIAERQARGMAVLMISDELDEYEGCDRVHVLFEGKLTTTFERQWSQAELLGAIEGVQP